MRRIKVVIAVLAVGMFGVAGATSPPVPKSLDERVKLASHIFTGVAEDIWIVDRNGRKVEPEPRFTGLDQAIGMKVRVDEVLYPDNWHTNASVTVLYGGGFFSASETRREFMGKKLIYLTMQNNLRTGNFTASYGWDLTETLDKRAEIEGLIAGNAGRK